MYCNIKCNHAIKKAIRLLIIMFLKNNKDNEYNNLS